VAISPIGSVTTTFATGGGTLQPRDASALAALAQGGELRALDSGRSGLDRVKTALTRLRDALQTARGNVSTVPGGTQLTPIVANIGEQALVVGYEAGNRPSLAVQDAVAALASSVSQLIATVGGSTARDFALDVSTLLRSHDLKTAAQAPDTASIDAALGQIDGVLAKADGLHKTLSSQATAAAQVTLSGLLLGADDAPPASTR
jgi:hypothetical protein